MTFCKEKDREVTHTPGDDRVSEGQTVDTAIGEVVRSSGTPSGPPDTRGTVTRDVRGVVLDTLCIDPKPHPHSTPDVSPFPEKEARIVTPTKKEGRRREGSRGGLRP